MGWIEGRVRAAWIGVPYLLAESLLLVEAGFHPLAYMPGLLFNLLMVSTSFLPPVYALAAVTSNFARLTMTVLGVLIVITGYTYLVNGIPHGYTSANPYTNYVLYPLLIAGCAAAIGMQYATRARNGNPWEESLTYDSYRNKVFVARGRK
jgi:hypothetical protein